MSQKEKMALIEKFARNVHTLVVAGDSSGLGSDIANVFRIVKGELQRKNVWSNLDIARSNTASLPNPPNTLQRLGSANARRLGRR